MDETEKKAAAGHDWLESESIDYDADGESTRTRLGWCRACGALVRGNEWLTMGAAIGSHIALTTEPACRGGC